jgi:uncharacterized membrane protein
MVLMTEGMAAAGGHWFSAKIALAVGLTIVVGLIHRQNATMARGTDMAPEEREKVGRTLGMLSMCSLILSVTVVALAVMAFG